MLALMMLLALGIYLAVSTLVVWLAVRIARKLNRRGWLWGAMAAFAMYNLVFWDWIPTVVMHKYYCATEAGFWIYKTPEQWAKENPGVLETLKSWPNPYSKKELELYGGRVTRFNDRFGLWSKWTESLDGLLVDRLESGIIDTQSRTFLVYGILYRAGPKAAGVVWKSWLVRGFCGDKKGDVSIRQMAEQLNMGNI